MLYGIHEKTTLKMTKNLTLDIQRTHAVLKIVSLQLSAKKERDLMEGELILIRLHTKKIHIVLSVENMSVDQVSNISIKVLTTEIYSISTQILSNVTFQYY